MSGSERPPRQKASDMDASESGAGLVRKRDRDSQFGPTTPGAEDPNFAPGGLGESVGASHAAKKNRMLSRDNSASDLGPSATTSSTTDNASNPFRTSSSSASAANDDLDVTPPGTPTAPSMAKSTSNLLNRNAVNEATPPGTPLMSGRGLPGNKSETSKVKEMRERVQEMTTGDATKAQQQHEDIAVDADDEVAAPAISSSSSTRTSSPPPPSIQEEISELPASAAEAENDPAFSNTNNNNENDDMLGNSATPPAPPLLSEPDPLVISTEDTGMHHDGDDDGDYQPLTRPAVAALGRGSSLMPPPSPASSVRAETGSNAGDFDDGTPQRPSTSRLSSVASMRSLYNNSPSANSSSGNLSHHLHLHSSLPKTASSLDTSDALSDISTEANPPGTPRPLGEVEVPPTPLTATAGQVPVEDKGTDAPVATPTGADSTVPSRTSSGPSAAGPASTTAAVQANFGRSAAAASSSSTASTSTPAKPFVNPFSAFGSSTASPFASSSSSSAFGSKSAAAPSTSSNLATVKPFASTSAFGSGSASPFASASSGKSAFGGSSKLSTSETPGAADDAEETGESSSQQQQQTGMDEEEPSQGKIFSSQSEVHTMTGEEEEYTQYMVPRAKLYVLDGGEWKERGVGQLRLNSRADPVSDKMAVRLVMRAEAVHRLILNISLFPGMSVTHAQDKFVRLSAFEEGSLHHFTVRIQNATQSKELYDQITDMISMLPAAGAGAAAGNAQQEV